MSSFVSIVISDVVFFLEMEISFRAFFIFPSNSTWIIDLSEILNFDACILSINESLKLKDGFYDLKYFINAINIGFNKNLPTDMSLSEIKKHI